MHGLATTVQESRQEFHRFVTEYAATIGAPVSTESQSSALDGIVDRMAVDPGNVALVPAAWPVPEGHGHSYPCCSAPRDPATTDRPVRSLTPGRRAEPEAERPMTRPKSSPGDLRVAS